MATMSELRRLLAEAEQARLELIKTGQEYTVVGSYSVKNMSLKDIEGLIARTKSALLVRQGKSVRRTRPDFR